MTMTLGEALTADDDSAFNLKDKDPSIEAGIDKARKELNKEERKKFNRGELDDGLKKAILGALDIALDDILGRAWSGWEDLRRYADPKKTPPDDVNVVPVGKHTIESEHEPAVEVVVHGTPVHRFKFHVSVRLEAQGVNLLVQGGMIQEIRLASLKLGGRVKLGERKLLDKEVAEVTIPGVMRLANPIPILWPHTK